MNSAVRIKLFSDDLRRKFVSLEETQMFLFVQQKNQESIHMVLCNFQNILYIEQIPQTVRFSETNLDSYWVKTDNSLEPVEI